MPFISLFQKKKKVLLFGLDVIMKLQVYLLVLYKTGLLTYHSVHYTVGDLVLMFLLNDTCED